MRRENRRTLAAAVGVGAAYVVTATAGLELASSNPNVTAVWPPTGIALAGLLIFGRRLWPSIALAAFTANLVNGAGADTAATIAVGNTLAPVVAASCVKRLGMRLDLGRLRDVASLVLVGGFGAMTISAVSGTIALLLTGAAQTAEAAMVFMYWWIGDSLGVVLVAPVILTWAAGGGSQILRKPFEATAAIVVAAGYAVFGYPSTVPVQFLIFPIAGWAALRLGPVGAATQVAVVAAVTVWYSAISGEPSGSIVLLQIFNAVVAVTSLGAAAVVAEREAARSQLQEAAAVLEDRVRERTEQLGEAQRIASLGSWSWDLATNDVVWSKELCHIYGLRRSNDAPDGVLEYIQRVHPDDRRQVLRAVRSCLATGEPFAHDYRIVRPSGDVRWVSGRGETTVDPRTGVVTGLRGICLDITSRKRAEEALRRSEERFRSLLSSAPDAVVVVDAQGKVVHANDHIAVVFGYQPAELIGRPVETLVPGHAADRHASHRRGYLTHPKRRPMGAGQELLGLRKDGTEVAVDISLSPLETEDGQLVIAAIRDVTERKLAEERLREGLAREREASERLRKVDEMKDAFLAAVSHELRTPLTSVLGLAMTLQRAEISGGSRDVTRLAERISVNAERLQRLLSDLLDLDRFSRGVIEPQRRPTDMRALVDGVLEHVDLGDHELAADVEDVLADVDAAQVERVIENLLVNASRHTPPGTPVSLTVRSDEAGLLVQVDDAGPGVADEDKESIFEPFNLGRSPVAQARGTGVGLALVAKFAELHGGRAWVEDRPGGGSRFRVLLAARGTEATTSVSVRPHEHDRARERKTALS